MSLIGNTIVNFTTQVNESGYALEQKVCKYLDSMNIPYRYNRTNGIDFIINGNIHMDCKAQKMSGSIGDKLPTNCFNYIRKYNLDEVFILQPYYPILQYVGEHLEHLEETMNVKIHILDWKDFTYLMNGRTFDNRKPYNYTKRSGIKLNPPSNMNINKFFSI